ncbi:LacI family DNA-binding transcriptional regulator [Ruegeria arenilitoris]|uniref:LacI family DNA-binding transcriptional regulator n=1 Tax=Ruegeria arenilitoris TaxID=1173585 RepID=UPI00147F0672|nr:LacI family DNA-binding transcriptional regulator [Ruegeria arenilitoris]
MSKLCPTPALADVAKLAGVSTATVSRYLNDPNRVVEATRQRELKAVDRLGYTPNFAARVMAVKRSWTIGAIIPTMENAIFARGLQAFQEELHQHGYTVLVSSSAYDPELEAEKIRTLVAHDADGVLPIGHDRDPKIYKDLARRDIPVMNAWSFMAYTQIASVGFDNRAAMAELANRAIRLGHQRIGVISDITTGNERARLRIEGIRDAARQNGLSLSNLTILDPPYQIENGAEAFSKLMSQGIRPKVILCGNDVLAVGALHRARDMGLKVPKDVSVTGFDDIELARVAAPALTTVHVPHREMGRRAAAALVDMLENRTPGASTRLATHIVERQSLGPPAST